MFRARSQPETFLNTLIMAVALRLNRKGTKDRPYYKIVAVDSRKRRDGRYIEQIGTYDPMVEGVNWTIDLEKADRWLGHGAKPSDTVKSIIRKARTGEVPAAKKKAEPAKVEEVKEEAPAAEAPAEEAKAETEETQADA